MPRKVSEKRKPQFNLDTFDVDGAMPCPRIGRVPHSIYGPPFIKQEFGLNVGDIEGAQSGTLVRGPKKRGGGAIRAAGTFITSSYHMDYGATPREPMSVMAEEAERTTRLYEDHDAPVAAAAAFPNSAREARRASAGVSIGHERH
jgi:hypothetical protein